MAVSINVSHSLSGTERWWRDSAIGVFATHTAAEHAIKELEKSGFDMKKLSIVGKGYHSEEHPVGFYITGDRIKTLGGIGAFWGGLWGVLFGAAFFWVPGVGALAAAGPIIHLLVTGAEGAALPGGMGVVAGALSGLGVPSESIIKYETQLKANNYLVIAHGSLQEVENARAILQQSAATDTEIVASPAPNIANHVTIS